MSEKGIKLSRLKGVNGMIKKLKAPQLKELLTEKDIAYKNADQAMLEVMNIEAISFGRSHMPLSWLPASLKVLQQQKLGMAADADGEEATAPAAKKQKQTAARFEFGAAKAAADRLIAASAGVGGGGAPPPATAAMALWRLRSARTRRASRSRPVVPHGRPSEASRFRLSHLVSSFLSLRRFFRRLSLIGDW